MSKEIILEQLSRPIDIKDIDFRVQSINKGGYATILAYKDARVDMNILDDVCGPENWQRDHKEIKGVVYCGIGIFLNEKWVWKWDAGTESMTEKQKGEASDSFKRAGFNWGIGRELYDYPLIQVKLSNDEYSSQDGKQRQTYELKLREWKWISRFESGKITALAAQDQNGKTRFKWGSFNNQVKQSA